jgi:SMC interacting uncharacterized protein involved in chromosome segregation
MNDGDGFRGNVGSSYRNLVIGQGRMSLYGGGAAKSSHGIHAAVGKSSTGIRQVTLSMQDASGGGLSSCLLLVRSRKSSVYGHSGRQDPRPNTDKAHMQRMRFALLQYLTEHNYDHPLSIKALEK